MPQWTVGLNLAENLAGNLAGNLVGNQAGNLAGNLAFNKFFFREVTYEMTTECGRINQKRKLVKCCDLTRKVVHTRNANIIFAKYKLLKELFFLSTQITMVQKLKPMLFQ